MRNFKYSKKTIITKGLSCVIMSAMLTANVAGAAEPVKNLDMLSPAVHLETAVFQQGIKQFMQELTPVGEELMDLKIIKQLLSQDKMLAENPAIKKLISSYEQAIEFNNQAEQYLKIAEQFGEKFNLKIVKNASHQYQNLGNLEEALLNALKALDFSANNIDLDEIQQILPEEKNQVLFEIIKFKAEICMALADFYSTEKTKEASQFYLEAKDNLAQAFSLPEVSIDFYDFAQMGTVYGRLGVRPGQKAVESLVFLKKAIAFFRKAQEQAKTLPLEKETAESIENMYYTFFTIFHVAAVFSHKINDDDQALRYYEQGERLIPNFIKDKTTLPRVNTFYGEYFPLLWEGVSLFLKGLNELEPQQQKESKAAGIGLFIMSSRVAQAYLSFIPRAKLTPQKETDLFLCIIESNIEAAKIESEINQDISAANAYLKQAAAALNKINCLNIRDIYKKHKLSTLNMEFIYQRTVLLKKLISSEGAMDKSFKIENYFEPEFFSSFISRYNKGKYKKLFKQMNVQNNYSNSFQELDQEIYHNSIINGFMKKALQSILNSKNKKIRESLAEKKIVINSQEFRRRFRYLPAVILAGLQIIDGEFEAAKKNIITAAGYLDEFKSSVSFRDAILPQLILSGESGQDCMASLLGNSHVKGSIINYFISNKDLLDQNMRYFFTLLLQDPKNIKLLADERIGKLIEALELPIQIMDKKDLKKQKRAQAAPVINRKPVKTENAIKTNDVLIENLEQSLKVIEQMKAPLPRKQRKKKKQKQLTKDSPEFKRFQKLLAEIIQTYEKLKSANLLTSIKALVQHPTIGQNTLLVRELAQALLGAETQELLDVLKILKEQNGSGAIMALKGELENQYQAQNNYFKRMDEFKSRVQELEQNIQEMNVQDEALSEVQKKIKVLSVNFYALINEFADISNGVKGKALLEQSTDSFEKILTAVSESLLQAQEGKIQDYVKSAWSYEQELAEKFHKITVSGLSKAELILVLRQWQAQEALIAPDADIADLAEVKQAQEKLQNQWKNIQTQITAAIEANSYICLGLVKFEVASDLNAINFKGVKFPNPEAYKTFVEEAVAVVQAVLKNNPQLDIEHQITGAEFESVENWLIPLVKTVKQKVFEQKSALQFAHDCAVKSERLEQEINELSSKKLSQLQMIKALEGFLSGDYEELPESIDEEMDPDHEIVAQAIKDFDKKTEEIQQRVEMMATVCKGLFVLNVEGEYENLFFVPKADKIGLSVVKNELHVIWAEALSYNLKVRLAIPEDVSDNEPWVKAMVKIWSEELSKAKKKQAQQTAVNTEVSADTGKMQQQHDFIQSAI